MGKIFAKSDETIYDWKHAIVFLQTLNVEEKRKKIVTDQWLR